MIIPVNRNILIDPLRVNGFIVKDKEDEKVEQVGTVLAVSEEWMKKPGGIIGYRVYFDSWLAGKYKNPDGEEDSFYWLVNWDDVKAIEKIEKDEGSDQD